MRRRLVLVTIPILTLLWVGIGVLLLEKHRMALDAAVGESRNLSRAFDENIVRTVEAIDITIRSIRTARALDPARFDLNAWLNGTGLPGGLTLQVSFSDRLGGVVQTNLGPMSTPTSIADREHFRVTRDRPDDGLFISRPVLGRVSGRWSVQFVRKLFDANGKFDGAIVASLDPAFLSRFYSSLQKGNGALLLLGEDGLVRAAAPDGVASLGADLGGSPLLPKGFDLASATLRGAALQDGLERIYSWRRLKEFGLIVVVGVATDDALAGFSRDLQSWSIAGGVLTLLTLLAGIMLARNRRDLVRSREILQAAVENISQGLMVIDPKRVVPVLNARAIELLNLPPELARLGVSFDALLAWQIKAGEFARPGSEQAHSLAEAGGVTLGTTVYRRTSREGRSLEIRTQALESGLAVRTFTDITDQEQTAHVLEEARDAAEAAARARSEFLATMSHEIRTPLNGVIGVAGLLEDMELGPEQRAYVRLIRESGDHLLQLINDILDFSRLEASQIELEQIRFDPRALVSGAIELFQAQARMKGLELSAQVDATVPTEVVGDPGRLRQILLNLVGNAIKFTDRGWVRIDLSARSDGKYGVRLAFAVADSGIGIEPAAVDRVFQEFTQVDGSISRRFGGSGLGLAICRRLVALLGGTIAVESKPGCGSTFRFDIASSRPGTLDAAAETAGLTVSAVMDAETRHRGILGPCTLHPDVLQQPGLQVLLAEDNSINRQVATGLLERLGHQVTSVADGLEAVAAVGVGHYELVLMDVMMPRMDGLAATRMIRAAERPGTHVAIVGLTAGARPDDLQACLEAGMDGVTTKPITLDRLRAAVADGRSRAISYQILSRAVPTRRRLDELRDELGHELVEHIVDAFMDDARTHLEALHAAFGKEDAVAMMREAHSLSGASRNIGADDLGARASQLEQHVADMSRATIAG